jgi:hypothetical protein
MLLVIWEPPKVAGLGHVLMIFALTRNYNGEGARAKV